MLVFSKVIYYFGILSLPFKAQIFDRILIYTHTYLHTYAEADPFTYCRDRDKKEATEESERKIFVNGNVSVVALNVSNGMLTFLLDFLYVYFYNTLILSMRLFFRQNDFFEI